ncbi:MAG: AGE family epimerase/isomerase [Candidatus Hydrogenedentota bacterium]
MNEEWMAKCDDWLVEVQDHLRDELLPYWRKHGHDAKFGGFLTYYDRDGQPTGETVKTLICQTRMIYTFASIHRAGLDDGHFLQLAQNGVEFLIDHFWDHEHAGWYWTTERDGSVINPSKLSYGQSFAMYALSEYGMASGDLRGMEWASKTFEAVQTFAADNRHGGYYEFLERDWQKKKPGAYGGDRKSFDVHMHLMEAFTNLYEATGSPIYRDKTREVVDVLFDRIINPEFGTGVAQFLPDWTPQRAIIFRDVWGSDRDVNEDEGRPLNNTSFGHNVEFAWLLQHTIDILGWDSAPFRERLRRLYDHCVAFGIDYERGGVYCEGPHDGPARERNKEFWQQAECLVGLLDAYLVLGDEKYLAGYEKVHRFVMDHVINHEVGEWFPLFDGNNQLLWDYMGHAWKINYHTVRSMIQSEARLLKITRPGKRQLARPPG